MPISDQKKISVLFVDDEIDICDFLSEYVQQKQLTPFYATEINTALKTAQREKLAAVFLDNNLLSNVKGVEYIPEFKKYNPECKVYMLSANSRAETKNRAEELGAEGFIEKPFNFNLLDQILENLS